VALEERGRLLVAYDHLGLLFLHLEMLFDRLVRGEQLGTVDEAVGQLSNEKGRRGRLKERGAAFWALLLDVFDERLAEAAVAVRVSAGGRVRFIEEAVADLARQERSEGLELGFQSDQHLWSQRRPRTAFGMHTWSSAGAVTTASGLSMRVTASVSAGGSAEAERRRGERR
jgi:hypothetical protein